MIQPGALIAHAWRVASLHRSTMIPLASSAVTLHVVPLVRYYTGDIGCRMLLRECVHAVVFMHEEAAALLRTGGYVVWSTVRLQYCVQLPDHTAS